MGGPIRRDSERERKGVRAMHTMERVLGTVLTAVVLMTVPFNVWAQDPYTPSGSNSFMYPGEPVPKDEMRVTIFGSGYGYVRGDQADQSFYVELGNGDTFVFDLGEVFSEVECDAFVAHVVEE